jgi:hypothetical protein
MTQERQRNFVILNSKDLWLSVPVSRIRAAAMFVVIVVECVLSALQLQGPLYTHHNLKHILPQHSARLTTPDTTYKQNMLCCRITTSPHMNTQILIQ